jgi:8-oxo-dGTP pyrophosphatase MutT (NUDIX family)
MGGAGLLILSKFGILLIRRSRHVDDSGTWDIPGGHVEDGETEFEAALREAREELGVRPPVRTVDVLIRPRVAYQVFVAQMDDCDAVRFNPPLGIEADDWDWFSPDDLPEPLRENAAWAISRL